MRKLTRRGGYQQARPQTPAREDTVTQLQINYHSHTRSQEDAVSPTLPLPTCAHLCPPPCPSPPVHTWYTGDGQTLEQRGFSPPNSPPHPAHGYTPTPPEKICWAVCDQNVT